MTDFPRLLEGCKIVSLALNLPGPAAARKLADLGAGVVKVEPPAGDPMKAFCPSWYERLHEGHRMLTLDLKNSSDRSTLDGELRDADLLLTSMRPKTLASRGLDRKTLRFPRLCHLAIVGFGPPLENLPAHDINYQAAAGLALPPDLPRSLLADLAGAERAVAMALALLWDRDKSGRGGFFQLPLAVVVRDMAEPIRRGLTGAPGEYSPMAGGDACYGFYPAKKGWIAVGALEPHFQKKLQEKLGLPDLRRETLRRVFATRTGEEWQEWALKENIPITKCGFK